MDRLIANHPVEYEEFSDALRGNVNAFDHQENTYKKLRQRGKTHEEALEMMQVSRVKTGRELFDEEVEFMRENFNVHDFRCVFALYWCLHAVSSFFCRTWLEAYSIQDVSPTVNAVDALRKVFLERGVSVFQYAPSLPSVRRVCERIINFVKNFKKYFFIVFLWL